MNKEPLRPSSVLSSTSATAASIATGTSTTSSYPLPNRTKIGPGTATSTAMAIGHETTTIDRKSDKNRTSNENNDRRDGRFNIDNKPQQQTTKLNEMTQKELNFERIGRQAHEFRDHEERRIATEKEQQTRRIAAEKEAERERIAQAYEESLEKQQEQLEAEQHAHDDDLLATSSSFESRASQPSPGTVKQRTEWLRKREEQAAERRRMEDEFNPNEAASDMVQNAESRLRKGSEDLDEEFKQIEAEILEAEEAKQQQILRNNKSSEDIVDVNLSPRDLIGEFCRPDTDTDTDTTKNDALPVSAHPPAGATAAATTTTKEITPAQQQNTTTPSKSNSNTEIKQQPSNLRKNRLSVLEYGAEVDPRTQAMLAEDDFVPPGNNNGNDVDVPPGSGMDDFTQKRNKSTLVVNNSIPVDPKLSRKSKGSSRNNLDDDDDDEDWNTEIVHKEATFELPMEVAEGGLKLSPNIADLSMITTIPPSRLGGRVSGLLEGRSSLGGAKSNSASGSASLEYKSSRHSRLTLGMIRGCEPHHPLITIGGRLLRHGSSVGVTFYHNANFLHQMMLEHSLWSLSFRHCFPNSKWSFSSQLSRRQDLSLSMTNGNKLSGLLGWNLLKPKQFHARIDARPKLTEYRRAHIYCQWKASSGGVWNFGVSLVQSLHSQIATVGLGWRLFSARGLEWVISWSRGNATIRIPIVVSKSIASNATIGQALYFSIVSYLIQDYVAEAWGWIGDEDDDDNNESDAEETPIAARTQNLTKARRDAAIQKELMARQARRKTKDEKERDGLIIKEAIYRIENGEEWDVTIPLQFWVTRSTLTLSARPKSELLGFYDIAASLKNSRAISAGDSSNNQMRRSRRQFSSWNDVWHDLLDWTPKDILLLKKAAERPSPTLTVSYEFKGRSHQIIVKDREELRLPHI